MKFGRILSVNMAPFHRFLTPRWLAGHEVVTAHPRPLGKMARGGLVDASCFSLADGLDLVASGEFEWLGSMGVAGFGPIHSILLTGVRSLAELEGQAVAVTPQTSTSVRLLAALLKDAGVAATLLPPGEPARAGLLIGDEALRVHAAPGGTPCIDLCEAWTARTGKPFVFARWAVRASLPDREKAMLELSLRSCLDLSLEDLDEVARAEAERTRMDQGLLLEYLKGIRYRLGPEELAGARAFEEMLR